MKRIVFTFRMVVILLSMMPLAVSAVTVEVKTAGTLEQVIDDSDEWSFKDLKIVGQLNATDILYLRTGTGRIATIENLDLAEVTVVSGGGAYATIQYSDNSVTMDNYKITFYSSDKNSKEVEMVSNMMGGNNYLITYYSNNLAGAFANSRMP